MSLSPSRGEELWLERTDDVLFSMVGSLHAIQLGALEHGTKVLHNWTEIVINRKGFSDFIRHL
jgi:hypothetical protein